MELSLTNFFPAVWVFWSSVGAMGSNKKVVAMLNYFVAKGEHTILYQKYYYTSL